MSMSILSKRTQIQNFFFTVKQPRHSSFFQNQTLYQYSDDDPQIGASNAGGVGNYLAILSTWLSDR